MEISKIHFMILCFCSLLPCRLTFTDEKHKKATRKTICRVKQALRTVNGIFEELTSLANETEVCNARLADVGKGVQNACKRIEKVGVSEIDISKKKEETKRTIRVDVKKSYDECVNRLAGHSSQLSAEIWCLRVALWTHARYNSTMDDLAEEALFGNNLNKESEQRVVRVKRGIRRLRRIAPRDITKPKTGYRIRKEYRALTFDERQRYHNAVKELYEDGTFSLFARVHRKGIREKGVHKGEAFLPWHRAFLALYEEALRQIDPTVSLPYWDSTVDYNMVTPILSVIWDEHHLGSGFGVVDDGPFAHFVTDDNPLLRNIGDGKGSLMKPDVIDKVFWYCRLGDIFKKLESAHNGVHRWIGGTMKGFLSASDPVFYMHHAFVDYIWETFRERQRTLECGEIDPSIDYPIFDEFSRNPTAPDHMPEAEMDGMEFLINRQGIENFWTENWYGYAERPSCANNCSDSEDMFCDEDISMCVGKMSDNLENVTLSLVRRKRYAATFLSPLNATTETSSSDENDSSGICRRQPYFRSCPAPSPPATDEDIASAIVNHQTPMPDEIARLEHKIQKNKAKVYTTPPESEPTFFEATGDLRNDCRTTDTAIYDVVFATLRGKKTTGKH